jgi:hypothetical protein
MAILHHLTGLYSRAPTTQQPPAPAAQGAVTPMSITGYEQVRTTVGLSDASLTTADATCPAGKVVGGGMEITRYNALPEANQFIVVASTATSPTT